MAFDLTRIDPQAAWRPFVPSTARPWGRSRAAHLFRRAAFAATSQTLEMAIRDTPGAAVAKLLDPGPSVLDFSAAADRLANTAAAGGGVDKLAAAWVYRMLVTPDPLREVMTLFWHSHFATSQEKVNDVRLMLQQHELFRQHALGRFEPLVHEVSCDPAMLVYLDSATNRKAHPNENYARELMELFCLGEGHYAEEDVREVARCFTGWEVRRGRYRFNRFEHDPRAKSILGATGKFGGEDAVRIILEQPEAPRFIVRKLFQAFICDEPAPPASLLEPLAAAFRDSGLDVSRLVQQILESDLFFSDEVIGRKVRSPVQLAVGLLRALEGSTDVNALARGTAQIGQSLFFPPSVKGWDGGRAWIDSSTLLGRANLIRRLLDNPATRFSGGGLAPLVERHGGIDSEAQIRWLAELLLAVPLSEAIHSKLSEIATSEGQAPEQRLRNTLYALCTLPEYQLS